MRTTFVGGLTADSDVTGSLVRLYRDNQRNFAADPIKYWIMSPECLDKLRKESISGRIEVNIHDRTDPVWKFMNIPIATVAVSGTNYDPYVEAVF